MQPRRTRDISYLEETIIKEDPRFTVRKNNKLVNRLNVVVIDKNLKIPQKSKVLNKQITKLF